MNTARKLLKHYQQQNFMSRTLSHDFRGFQYRAYPETAKGLDLDGIGRAIKILPRHFKNGKPESCESFRKRILIALDTPDPEDENQEAA